MATAAPQSSTMWRASSGVSRYGRGTATTPSLRQACMATTTSVPFGPHHTTRSPARTPSRARPSASRFTRVFSAAQVVTAPASTTAAPCGSVAARTASGSPGAIGGNATYRSGTGRRHPTLDSMSRGWIRRLWPFLMAHRRDLLLSFGAALVGLAVSAFTPVIQKVIIDDVILESPPAPRPVAGPAGRRRRVPVRRGPRATVRGRPGVARASSSTCATPSTSACSGWTSPATTTSRPASSSPAPAPTSASSRRCWPSCRWPAATCSWSCCRWGSWPSCRPCSPW